MANDTIDRMRELALKDMAEASPTVVPFVKRRAKSPSGAPAIPSGVVTVVREELPLVLREGAALEWRRATQAWSPPLDQVASREVLRVRVTGKGKDGVEVELRNGTYRARGMPSPWVPVVVAMLTGRELVPVRRAIRTGVTEFERTGTE